MKREKSSTPSAYQLMSVGEKHAASIARHREPSVTCPDCDTQVMPEDLLAHISGRCTGPRTPGPSAKWLTWREALAMGGVTKTRLSRWSSSGAVRHFGERQDRRYLLRDLALKVAQLRGFRRR